MHSIRPPVWGVSRRIRACLFAAAGLYIIVFLVSFVWPWSLPTTIPYQGRRILGHDIASLGASSSKLGERVKQQPPRPHAKIGKVTMLYGDLSPVYERALVSHEAHAQQHGYPMYVLRQQLLEGLWSKPAYLMAVVTAELQKPANERLEWLFWFDADTYILNPNVPLEAFLPPADDPAFAHLSFLCGNDHHGLNYGAFLLRIEPWTLDLLAAAIALPRFRPDLSLPYTDQSAVEWIVAPPEPVVDMFPSLANADDADFFTSRRANIPQRWLNAYVGRRAWDGTPLDPVGEGKKQKSNSVREGDMLVHFAGHGTKKRERMTAFMDAAEVSSDVWVKPFDHTGIGKEVARFWKHWKTGNKK